LAFSAEKQTIAPYIYVCGKLIVDFELKIQVWVENMNNSLINVRRTLHELLKALPAVKANSSAESLRKHIALIRFYQQRYDELTGNLAVPA